MKVYIASKFENVSQFHQLKEALESEGHEVTHDWTKHKADPSDSDYREKMARFASEDYAGVLDAQVLILVPVGKETPMAGAFVELGIAIHAGLDVIIVDGFAENRQQNVFYRLPFPWIMHVDTLKKSVDLVTALQWDLDQALLDDISESKPKSPPTQTVIPVEQMDQDLDDPKILIEAVNETETP